MTIRSPLPASLIAGSGRRRITVSWPMSSSSLGMALNDGGSPSMSSVPSLVQYLMISSSKRSLQSGQYFIDLDIKKTSHSTTKTAAHCLYPTAVQNEVVLNSISPRSQRRIIASISAFENRCSNRVPKRSSASLRIT